MNSKKEAVLLCNTQIILSVCMARKVSISATCYLERVLERMQLFPLDPLIDFFLLRLGTHIDVFTGVELLKDGFVIIMFNIFISTIHLK